MIAEVREGLVVVGTAHVSAKSVETVEQEIRARRPKQVLVELDTRRYEALRNPDEWQNTDVVQILREKKQHLFLLQLYLANMQARMGEETGVAPGGDMLRAIEVADEVGAQVVLIDRDIRITLKRGFGALGFWRRIRLLGRFWAEILTPSKENGPVDVDGMLETDAITAMTEEFAAFAPEIKEALIDERDTYMASHIHERFLRGGSLVAVVGAGHLPGIQAHLARPDHIPFRQPLEQLPPNKFTVGKALSLLIPAAILGMFIALLAQGRYDELASVALTWVLLNGGLSALGALLAGGHPYSILVAFVAAPITSLNPTLAAGWFAGLTEAKVRTPTVRDFQAIRKLDTFRSFWGNGVVRIILVTALANLGSTAATYIAGSKIIQVLAGGS